MWWRSKQADKTELDEQVNTQSLKEVKFTAEGRTGKTGGQTEKQKTAMKISKMFTAETGENPLRKGKLLKEKPLFFCFSLGFVLQLKAGK